MALYKLTSAQLRAIFALARRLEMDTDDLHGIAYRIGGVDSLKKLTANQAGRMIEELKGRAGQSVKSAQGGEGRITEPQRRKLYVLTRELGWIDQPERLRGWLRKMFGVDDARFLTPAQASKAIDGLKTMRDQGRAERREVRDG